MQILSGSLAHPILRIVSPVTYPRASIPSYIEIAEMSHYHNASYTYHAYPAVNEIQLYLLSVFGLFTL